MSYLVSTAIQSHEVTATLTGAVGTTYRLGVRIRGVIDFKSYTGGTPIQKYVQLGGTPAADNNTVASLVVSSPAATYYLNVSPNLVVPLCNFPVDYVLDILAVGNATIKLKVDNIDLRQYRGDAGGLLINQPPLGIYDGIWLRADTEPSEPLVEYTVTTGAGIRGWLWSAFAENVYGNKADR